MRFCASTRSIPISNIAPRFSTATRPGFAFAGPGCVVERCAAVWA
jgi:hypothetical protein